MFLFVKTLSLVSLCQVKGDNIMLGKPCKQSSTYNNGMMYDCGSANDGIHSTVSATNYTDQQPYWQGDLQGYFRILNITVTVDMYDMDSSSLSVGGSVLDATSPGTDVITCGQWHGDDTLQLQTFSCNFPSPVRFIKIWQEVQYYLDLREVDVQGIVGEITEINFEQTDDSKMVSTPTASFNISTRAECASICFNTQPCITFSFRQGGQLNCLLATDFNLTSATEWATYTVKSCRKYLWWRKKCQQLLFC